MNFPTSICNSASSPPRIEPKLIEVEKFDAGKQSSATLIQHIKSMSNKKACRVERTTSGEPDLENLADITLILSGNITMCHKNINIYKYITCLKENK